MSDKTAIAEKKKRIALKGLTAAAFQHPLDRQATENLKRLHGFDWLVGKFVEYGIERTQYVKHIGGSIRVGPKQMARHYQMLRECCYLLDVPEPQMYLTDGGERASTFGHNHPTIVLSAGLLGSFSDDEVMAFIARELGHIKCGHVLYKSMLGVIKPLFEAIDEVTMGIGGLVGTSIEAGLLLWERRSKLSADRAALLALQDDRPILSMLMKIAGGSDKFPEELSLEQFLLQARAYQEGLDQTMSDRFYRFLVNLDDKNTWAIERARAIDEWFDTDEYKNILGGNYSGVSEISQTSLCPNPECRCALVPNEMFCSQCGVPLSGR